jgi:hypothetical protein
MDRFVRPLTEEEKERRRRDEVRDTLVQRFDEVRSVVPDSPKPWLSWDVRKKQKYVPPPLLILCHLCHRVAEDYDRFKNYSAFKIQFGLGCPPRRTMQCWAEALKDERGIKSVGRYVPL